MNGMKIIILKYSFIPLFGSLSGREWTLFSQIFTPPPPKLEGIERKIIRFNEFFTKTSKKSIYIHLFILKYGSKIYITSNKPLCVAQIFFKSTNYYCCCCCCDAWKLMYLYH